MEVMRLRGLQIATIIYIAALANIGDPLLLGQEGSAASHRSLLGTVKSVTTDRLYVNGPYGSSVVVLLDRGGRVIGKGTRHDFLDVHVGDQVLMRGQRNASGNFVVSEVWVNFTSSYGRVLSVNALGCEVRVVTEAGEVTDETRKVAIDSETLGEGNQVLQRGELVPGRDVQIFGIKRPDGSVLATRVLILRQNVPAGATIITPNGNKVTKK